MFGYKTEKYAALTGHEFSVKNFLADRKNEESPLSERVTLKFGGGKEINCGSYNLDATIVNPNGQTMRKIADACIRQSGLLRVSQDSDLHRLSLFGGEGSASLEFRINGEGLQGEHVRYAAVDNPGRVQELIKSWTRIAETLGFETHIPKTVNLGGCEAVKLCTRYRNIAKGDETPYILNTLLANNNALEAKLLITSLRDGYSASISKHCAVISVPVEETGLQFVLNMFGEVGQPLVEYKLKAKPQLAKPWQSPSRLGKAFEKYFPFTIMPLMFGISGAITGIKHGDPLAYGAIGAGIGSGIEAIAIAAWKAGSTINKWQAKKKNRELRLAHERLAKLAEESSYLKQGFCVLLTTQSCATKAQLATAAPQ